LDAKKSNMKRKHITVAFLMFLCFSALGQDIQKINGFNYLSIQPITYQNGATDIYSMMPIIRDIFINKGFGYYPWGSDQVPQELQKNPCQLLSCQITQTGYINQFSANAEITLTFADCNGNIVYTCKSKGSGIYSSYEGYFQKAVKKALHDFEKMPYQFNNSYTPKLNMPEVEQSNETEQSLTQYFDTNTLDEIEGIYKSYQTDQLGYYKIGIKKYGNKYKAIIIESEGYFWKQGEIKAIFEPSSMKGFFSTKWFMNDKTPFQTFGNIDNEAILSIEFKDVKTGEKIQDKFIKMYPAISGNTKINKGNSKSSGSGFFVTTGGVIATNSHVIEGASNIQVTVSNEIGLFTYNAKVIIKDSKNDVALLQIEDEKFKGLSSIPYSFSENSDVGSKVFTIGYPLNDLMGSNYKVTDGIISSKSGIADDVRYYQISVPLQPGNSGGPLFNKDGNIIGITSARLNGQAIGTQIENVNYAIKTSYLLNLYNMLPNSTKLSNNSITNSKELQDQVKILKNYVCLIKVF